MNYLKNYFFKNQKQYISILSVIILSSCSSIESMKFWGNDDIDLDEPRPLVSFTSKLNTSVDWSMKFNGENTLGNFIPAFSGDNIFASDNTGNIKSIDIKSGNINWEIETNFLSSGTAA
ncbi:outer membrane protein assembly factor BamB, partial [Gammaproteobacteria bacterium]|nr:outer membrane protein assembly factor BamB [Gammaproteobacteria bacterium]